MKYLVDMTKDEIEKGYPDYCIPVIALDSFTLEPLEGSTLEEIISLSATHEIAVDATGLCLESRFTEFSNVIKTILIKTNNYLLFSDLSVFNILQECQALSRGIYAPETLIMNKDDLEYYASLGVTVGLSLENSGDELRHMCGSHVSTLIDLYGYHRYLVTPRRVISAYNEGNHVNLPKSGVMRENNRFEWYSIEENEHGTWVMSPKPFAVRQLTLNDLNVSWGRIKRYKTSWTERLSILNAYHESNDAFSLELDLREAPMKGETVLTKVKNNE